CRIRPGGTPAGSSAIPGSRPSWCRWCNPRCAGCWRARGPDSVRRDQKGAFQDMAYSTIRCATDDGVALITLARPDKLNAINAAMHAELRTALDAARDDPAVRCVVLTGE